MFKVWWARLKEAAGVTPKPGVNPIDSWLDSMESIGHKANGASQRATDSRPSISDQYHLIKSDAWRGSPHPKPMSRAQSIAMGEELKYLLRPRLVVDNTGVVTVGDKVVSTLTEHDKAPPLFVGTDKRRLNPEWVMWRQCCNTPNHISYSEAWREGAKLLMDNEFQAKMRANVEICPPDPDDPYLVRIKYHDPVKEPR